MVLNCTVYLVTSHRSLAASLSVYRMSNCEFLVTGNARKSYRKRHHLLYELDYKWDTQYALFRIFNFTKVTFY